MTIINCAASPVDSRSTRVGFLLLDKFTMIALASAVEPLRMANQLSGKELYHWQLIGADGGAVRASDGITVTPDASIDNCFSLDMLLVVGGVDITHSYSKKELAWLRSLDRRDVALGGICTGAYVLAHAGLLDGYECSTHWECLAPLREAFPKVNCNTRLFTVDRDRLTCSGGGAPLDMMLHQVTQRYGGTLAGIISDMFVCDRIRTSEDQQRVPLRHMLSTAQPKLEEIVQLMEANIEEPIELDRLADFVGISRRQLERLFHKYLHCTPCRYYLKLRLDRARQLLKHTAMSIIEISAACGFVSAAHFSRCYRKYVGQSPRQARTAALGGNQNGTLYSVGADARRLKETRSPVSEALIAARREPSYASVRI